MVFSSASFFFIFTFPPLIPSHRSSYPALNSRPHLLAQLSFHSRFQLHCRPLILILQEHSIYTLLSCGR
jgi:hypothetical protein